MADSNNEPSHNSEALHSDLNEAANHVDSTPQTCGPSPTVKAASLRLTRAHRRLARKGSYSNEKPEETPTSRPQTRPSPRHQQPPKRPAATQRNRGCRAAAITKPAAISTATQTDEFPSQSPPRNEESSGASSSSPTTSSSSSSSWEHETPATSPSSESESVVSLEQPEQGASSAAAAGTNPARDPSVQPQTGFLSQPVLPSPDVTGDRGAYATTLSRGDSERGSTACLPPSSPQANDPLPLPAGPPKELSRPLREEVPLPTTSGVSPSPQAGFASFSPLPTTEAPGKWDALDTLHRGVVRRLYGLPRSSPIGPTLAEAGETSLSLRARGSVLRHIHRMYLTSEGRRLAGRLLDRPHSGMGQRALEYAALVPDPPYCGLIPIPPHQDPDETTEHILLHCPGYTEQRRWLFDAYGRLGLPHGSLDHLRFPQAHHSSLMRALEALLEFFGDAALIARL
ncbi:hypothetical protein MRX96_043470 [Rhipicephalus microplus]